MTTSSFSLRSKTLKFYSHHAIQCACANDFTNAISPLMCVSTKARTSASIILRGANDFMCDEMERSLHDALCVVKRVLESKSVVPGGGAVEAALSIYLENYATSMVSIVTAMCENMAKSIFNSWFGYLIVEYFHLTL